VCALCLERNREPTTDHPAALDNQDDLSVNGTGHGRKTIQVTRTCSMYVGQNRIIPDISSVNSCA
jgi:hypothetical protein